LYVYNAKTVAELLERPEAKRARLRDAEIIALRLYSGPMFAVYNPILRPGEDAAGSASIKNLYRKTLGVLEQRQAVQHLHPLSRAQCSLQTMLRLPVCIQLRACVHVCLYVFVSYQQHPKRHGLPPTTSGVKSCLFGSGTCWLSRDSVRRALGRVPSRARGRHSLTSVGL